MFALAGLLLFSALNLGPFPVGYRSEFLLDASRPYDGKPARPILFQIWYPAANNASGPRLNYEAYFEIPHLDAYPALSASLTTFARQAAAKDLQSSEAFARLLVMPTAARSDAPEAPGKFPVVIYHPGAGGSFEENALLFEYLASFGYIVISSAFQSPFADSPGNNLGGIERSGPDMTFLANQARNWPNADPARIAAIGHSAGAQAILQWIGDRACPIRAAVSLDSTLEYDRFLYLHRYVLTAFEKLTPPTIPVLLVARTKPKPGYAAFRQYLRFSPHRKLAIAGLKHDDFLSHGFLGRELSGSKDAQKVHQASDQLCRTVKTFLDRALAKGPAYLHPLK